MKSERELKELAEKHNVKTVTRHFFEARDDEGRIETRFMDLPRPRDEIVQELRDAGAWVR